MSMGKGLRMVMMTDRRSEQEQGGSRTGNRTYNLDGTYNVRVGDGSGNRSQYGGERTGDRRIGDPRSGYNGGMGRDMPMENRYTGGMGREMPMENRYRGEDGRYRAGRRPARMGMEEMRTGDRRRMGDDEEDEEESTYKVKVIPQDFQPIQPMTWPYAPGMEQGGERYANYGREDERDRQIGFGASMHMDGGHQQQEMRTGSMSMQPYGEQLPRMNEETAMAWVDSMEGEDRSKPKGGKWSPEQLEPLAKKHGVPTSGPEWWAFYAVVNAMYSDYCEVAKAYNITSPDFYAKLALAFMRDRDALPEKVERYLRYVVGM